MKTFDEVIKQLSSNSDERLLEVARFAELGMSASAVIHEVRQPLTALSMALQMALESARRGDKDTVETIEESIRLAGRTELLLERARDFMTPSQGRAEIDILDSIERVISVFQWHVRTADEIRFKIDVASDVDSFFGDRSQFEQCIANLVGNAVDALLSRGSGLIHVIARALDDDRVRVIVADNGMGIPLDAQAHIFEPFFSTKSRNRGTGLGLYIVQKVAADHLGSVSLMPQDSLDALGLGRLSTGFQVDLARDRSSVLPED